MYKKIYNDNEIINRYIEIEKYEELNKGWAYHNLRHVLNVVNMVEKILIDLNYDDEYVESAKIAALLHDTGANKGKKNHALRSCEFAKEYFKKNNIHLKYEKEILESIRVHSDGFETNNIMALSIILADKLDVKSNRISEEGKKIIGNRQYSNIKEINLNIEKNSMTISFITNNNFDALECEEYYFTKKIFKAIKSFCAKTNLNPIVKINNNIWKKFTETNM